MYVITLSITDGRHVPVKYLASDYASGGYLYWSELLRSANQYKTTEECFGVLASDDFTKDTTYGNGSINPPHMIRSGLELGNYKELGKAVIEIQEITLTSHFSKTVKAARDLPLMTGKLLTLAEAREYLAVVKEITVFSNRDTCFVVDDPLLFRQNGLLPDSYTGVGYQIPYTTVRGVVIASLDHLLDRFYPHHKIVEHHGE